jgi:tetratricopeptide (TPR) repeat protein
MRCLLVVCTVVLWASTAVAQPASLQGPGWDALRAGDHEQAREAFQGALASRPSDALLHLGLGVATHVLGDDVEARRVLTRALALEPRLTPATALLGEIVYASGDLPGAIAVYERGLRGPRASAVLKPRLDEWRAEANLHAGFEARDAGRFTLLIEGPEERRVADRVHRVLEAAYARIGGRLNAFPDEPIPVILYTAQRFQDVTRSPQWAGGLYDGRIRLAVGGGLDDPASLDRVVVHELAHAFVQHIAPGGVPAWLHEGLAVLFEQGDERWIDQHLHAAGRLSSLSSLEGGFTDLNAADAALAYAQSAAAARVLTNRLGPNLAAFLQSLDRSQSLDAALATFGFTTADIESAVRARAR